MNIVQQCYKYEDSDIYMENMQWFSYMVYTGCVVGCRHAYRILSEHTMTPLILWKRHLPLRSKYSTIINTEIHHHVRIFSIEKKNSEFVDENSREIECAWWEWKRNRIPLCDKTVAIFREKALNFLSWQLREQFSILVFSSFKVNQAHTSRHQNFMLYGVCDLIKFHKEKEDKERRGEETRNEQRTLFVCSVWMNSCCEVCHPQLD